MEDDVDIGIIPSQGLVPPELSIRDIDNSKATEAKPQYQYKCSCPQGVASITQQITSQVRAEDAHMKMN